MTELGGPVAKTAIRTFRDLIALQKAHARAVHTYRLVSSMPTTERFALSSQITRAITSVSGNIAEGFGLGTQPGFLRHLRIARGSLFEASSHLEVAFELGMIPADEHWQEPWDETDRVLQGLIKSVERDLGTPST